MLHTALDKSINELSKEEENHTYFFSFFSGKLSATVDKSVNNCNCLQYDVKLKYNSKNNC